MKKILLALFVLMVSTSFAQPCREVVGYYPGWKWYNRNKLVKPSTIDYSKYSIINYAFFKPMSDGSITGNDPWGDENLLLGDINWSTNPPSHYPNTSLVDIAHNNNVKILISVGGWTLSDNFPAIAADPVKRTNFASSCVQLISTYHLDGIDIDWEYPGYAAHNGTPADKQNFTYFLQEIRDSIDVYGQSVGQQMLLTAAVGASPDHMNNVEWQQVGAILDIINLMSYDYFGAWEPVTNHNAPLYAPLVGNPDYNLNASVQNLIQQYGVSPAKITAGVAFYGRSVKTSGVAGLHVPSLGSVDNVTFADDDGSPQYYNVVNKMNLFSYHWDGNAAVPYLTGNNSLNTFVSYDDPASIALKAQYIVSNNLRGAIIWEITGDYMETSPGSGTIAGTPLADTLNHIFCSWQPVAVHENTTGPLNDFSITPSLFGNSFTVSWTTNIQPERLIVLDDIGEVVYKSESLTFNSMSIDAENWSSGVYFLHLESANISRTARIVKL